MYINLLSTLLFEEEKNIYGKEHIALSLKAVTALN